MLLFFQGQKEITKIAKILKDILIAICWLLVTYCVYCVCLSVEEQCSQSAVQMESPDKDCIGQCFAIAS